MGGFILGVDPGVAHMGLALIDCRRPAGLEVVEIALVQTSKDKSTPATQDNLRRLQVVATGFRDFVGDRRISVICAEAMSFPQNAVSAMLLASAWGVLALYAVEHGRIPIVVVQPQAIKKAAGVVTWGKDSDDTPEDERRSESQRKKESKRAVQEALSQAYPPLRDYLSKMNLGDREHPADAVGAYHALRDSELVRLARTHG